MRVLGGLSEKELVAELNEVQRQIAALNTHAELVQLVLRFKEATGTTVRPPAAHAKAGAGSVTVAGGGSATVAATGGTDRPTLKAAILSLMADSPHKVWTPTELHAALDAKGWAPEGTAARAQISNRLAALVKSMQVTKLGKGRYALPQGTEGSEETGLFVPADPEEG
jgi:hypothetical protein